ncbi:protein PHR1-LIKE 2-like isoform X2 [Zingiber officinale]|uniref:protein PHR1-LIKE 2-like isoform X2 n=1 Tax=Zingiber officinale TaxID=94328 RepID=UPI001C4DCBBB|nr:protein PHR1-LIKE 2-like isoform X2 [Zingiber officinale]
MLNIVEATPKAIMRTMGVKGLTLFHLKSHLQKYRLGKQSAKELTEQSKDVSYLSENPSSSALSPRVPTPDVNEGQEVKEALRAQMEVQRRLFEQVEVQRHVQIRMDAYQKYIDTLLVRAYKIASEQVASNSFPVTEHELPDRPVRAICAPSDILSPAVLHQLSMNSINMPSSSCKTLPHSTIESLFFYQKPSELKNKPC